MLQLLLFAFNVYGQVWLLVPALSYYWLMKLAKRAPMEGQAAR